MFALIRSRLIVYVLALFLLITCAPPPGDLQVGDISASPKEIIFVGETASLHVQASGSNLEFEWSVLHGKLSNTTLAATDYTAPDSPGTDTVTVKVSGSGKSQIKSIKFNVIPKIVPSAALTDPPIPTAAPTIPPSPTTAPRPTQTPIVEPTVAEPTEVPPTDTSTTTSAGSITAKDGFTLNLVNNGDVARTMTLLGEYPNDLSDDIWVFIVPPNLVYYPQSNDACTGINKTKLNGKWEMRVGFGGPNDVGLPFEAVLATADKTASKTIVDTLKSWCKNDHYPGMDVLPAGVTEKIRVSVNRTVEQVAPAPAISNTELPGEIAVTSIADGADIEQAAVLKGTYSTDATADVWVLVTATNGKWYPQSANACKGIHVTKKNGQWSVPAGFGGPNNAKEPFDIVVVLADASANATFDALMKQWCATNNYPGLLTIELPQGIQEKARLRVIRK